MLPKNINLWRYSIFGLLLLMLMGATNSCEVSNTADAHDQEVTAQQQEYFSKAIPVPQLSNSIQRQMMVYWYKMLDNPNLVMYTTITSQTGTVLSQLVTRGPCIPADTQLTNPEKIAVESTYGVATLPQPEPNGLFMGDGSNGTLCFTTNGNVVYTEGIVTSSLKPVEVPGSQTIKIPETGKPAADIPVFKPQVIPNSSTSGSKQRR